MLPPENTESTESCTTIALALKTAAIKRIFSAIQLRQLSTGWRVWKFFSACVAEQEAHRAHRENALDRVLRIASVRVTTTAWRSWNNCCDECDRESRFLARAVQLLSLRVIKTVWRSWKEFVAKSNKHIVEQRQKRNDAIMLKLKSNAQRKMKQVTATWRNMAVKSENEKQLIGIIARVLTKWRLRSLLWALHIWKVSSNFVVSTIAFQLQKLFDT